MLRGTDLTRLMVTLGVSLMLGELANRNSWLTGGADGLDFTIGPVLGQFPIDFTGRRDAALYSFVVVFAAVRAGAAADAHRRSACRCRRSARTGCAPARSASPPIGGSSRSMRLAAAYAGAAGALLAQTTQIVSLDIFDFHRSADVLLMLIIGGAGYLYGG